MRFGRADWCRAVDGQRDAHAMAVQAQCRVARNSPVGLAGINVSFTPLPAHRLLRNTDFARHGVDRLELRDPPDPQRKLRINNRSSGRNPPMR